VQLAERYSTPVWVSPNSGRCSFPESHPLFAGFLPPSKEAIVRHLEGYDIVLALGAPVFTYHTEGFGPFLPAGTRLFLLINNPDAAALLPIGSSIVTSLHLGIGQDSSLFGATIKASRPSNDARANKRRQAPCDNGRCFPGQGYADISMTRTE
jgi:benzoylformate decarboxylase